MEVKSLLCRHSVVKVLSRKVDIMAAGETLFVEGLQGSAAAAYIGALRELLPHGRLFVVVLNDEDEAAYFYGDLQALYGETDVMFFPSPYKRGVKYASIDPANEILRTDVLSRLATIGDERIDKSVLVVTYPEALAVKVVTQETLSHSFMEIEVGREYDFSGIERKLFDLGFRHVDYVFEPGEFAIRGSIVDVFSYSSELPFRIDFFGDEVDSIRTFDVQTQLSQERMESARLVPFVAGLTDNRVSFLDLLPETTVLVQKNPTFVCDSIGKIYEEGFSRQALIERRAVKGEEAVDDVELSAAKLLLDAVEFGRGVMRFPSVVMATRPSKSKGAVIKFSTTPQPLFHKNFDLICDVLNQYSQRKFKIHIFAD
ncbi:MAG: transcription-repair coupling factor, partial [Bacteroidaceae bacterium]